MIKYIFLLLIIPTILFSQSPDVDTVITTPIFKSYFDIDLKQPLQLNYYLYSGGGNCDRSRFKFINDTKIETATQKDYLRSGFDMGHLANAEDFAGDCKKLELTFRFYNCLPQYPNLNRGIWKVWENKIRQASQTDSLLIICGAKFPNKNNSRKLQIPDYCYKVVKCASTDEIKWVLWFKNTKKDSDKFFELLTLSELESRLGYKLNLKY